MSDTTTIDEIMEDMYWEYKNSSESYCLIPNRVRHILTRHLAPQPSVSELIEKREKKEIPFPDSYGDLMDMFLADLRHLKPQSEEVEKTSEYVIEKIISFVCFKIEMIGVVSKRREDEFVWDLRDYLTDLLRSSEAECGEKPSEEVEIKRITRWYHKCKCWYWEVRYDNKYCPNCWKKILRVDQPSDEKWEERYRATECDDKDCLCHQVKPKRSKPKK